MRSRISLQVFFPAGASRLRLGLSVAEAWGLSEGEDLEVLGFFRDAGELLCLPAATVAARGQSPLMDILALESANSASTDVPLLQEFPPTVKLVAPDRLVRFQLRWTAKQFDLQLGKELAKRISESSTPTSIWLITWLGWLVLLSEDRYQRYQTGNWADLLLRSKN
jgi:hypothetical protein